MAEVTARTRTRQFQSSTTTAIRSSGGERRSPYLALFIVLLIAYSYVFPRWADWNQNSRFDLTRAIVEQGTVRIDAYVANTGDYATIDGHAYSDKAPGLSLAAVPVYGVLHAVRPLGPGWVAARIGENDAFARTLNPDGKGTNADRIYQAMSLYVLTLACVAVPAALLGVVLARMIARISGCRTAGIASALIVGLATPVFTYSQAFYGHIPAAACIGVALGLLVLADGRLTERALFGVGLLLGTALLFEYPSAVAGVPIALYALALAGRRAVLFGIVGAIAPLVTLAAYDVIAFGTPLPVGYEHSTLWQEQHQQGFMSLTRPTWDALWGLTGGSFRGLFFISPVLSLALAGVFVGARRATARVPIAVSLASFLAMLLFAASSVMWWGGFAVGPRYILPAVPLLALPLGMLIAEFNRAALPLRLAGLAGIAGLAAVSATLTWGLTLAGQGYPPDTIADPIGDYMLPAFRDGDIARNLGMALGLDGVFSLVPLAALLALGVAVLGRSMLRHEIVAA